MKHSEDSSGPAVPWLVAHRGYPVQYPENTLIGYQAALDCGARYVELDVQLTADAVPVLHHDADLKRMAGVDKPIFDVSLEELAGLPAAFQKRFGERFIDNRFITLAAFCEWFAQWPQATVFVEIKEQSIERFGRETVMARVYESIAAALAQSVIISFDDRVVELARQDGRTECGWVLPDWNRANRARAGELRPDYLFCNTKRFPGDLDRRWQGDWHWVPYNIDDVAQARRYAAAGFEFLETNRVCDLMQDNWLAGRHPDA